MKKALALILALVMALSLTVPAFAAENDKSGNTTITATKAAPFSYEISIPSNVPEITAAGVYEVGQAKVTDVVSAANNTVISYTATTTDFKLSTDESKTMAATYYTEQAAENTFPTDAVTVYENGGDAASIPTMWVKITGEAWEAAAAGTYTATVTFNFEAGEKVLSTVADVLNTVPGGFPTDSEESRWWADNNGKNVFIVESRQIVNTDMYDIPLTDAVTKEGNNYTTSISGGNEPNVWTTTVLFTMTDGVLTEIKVTLDMGASHSEIICTAPTTT